MARFKLTTGWLACLLAVALVGCQATQQTTGSSEAPPPKKQTPVKTTYGDPNVAYFPTGVAQTSILRVDRTSPAEVSVGSEFDYQIIVTNISNSLAANNVVVTETVDGGLEIVSASPNATGSGGSYAWNLGTLLPGQSETINIKAKATAVGEIVRCVNADFTPVVCLTTVVTKPALELVKEGPTTVMLCDPITYRVTVTNSGSGAAKNVVITDTLPEGLVTATSEKREVQITVGTLAAGESKAYDVAVRATKTGEYSNTATASADGGLSAKDDHKISVVQPVLEIAGEGPGRIFIGREACHVYTVKNTGNAAAANTVLTVNVNGGTFVSATGDAQSQAGTVSFNLGSIAAGESRKVQVCHKAGNDTRIASTASVNANCADAKDAKVETAVEGIPALLLEVVDIDDPDEVGTDEEYVITVTNQGSANATNVTIVATLEDSMGFVSGTGATEGKHTGGEAGGKVTFAPLPSLAPKAKASWTVTVKALKAGDVRFGVEMTADQLTRPVIETESTNFYE